MTMPTPATTTATTAAAAAAAAAFAGTQIPIWVCGKELWISGVDRKTTVDQVVESLLGRPDKQYSITEKWRQVERPLSGDTRILKLWKTWGDAKGQVKLSLKKIQPADKNSDKNALMNSTKKKTRYYKSACSKYGQTLHPKRLAELSKNHGIERLLKLILVQGETIQNQISKLKNRQHEIEQLENEQLEFRMDSLGTKYPQNTYLIMNEEKDDGVTPDCVSSDGNNGMPLQKKTATRLVGNDDDNECDDENRDNRYDQEITIEQDIETEIEELKSKIYFLDKIVKINKKLEKEEEHLVRLFVNIERCKEDGTWRTTATTADESNIRFALNRLETEIERSEMEFDDNRKLLARVENSLLSRKYHLKRLHDDFHDETNQYAHLHSSQDLSVPLSITQCVLPYYAYAAAATNTTTTTINKPVLNTLV